MAENLKIHEIVDSLKEYYNTNYDLRKLEATERSSVIGAGLISIILIGLVVLFFVLFISLGVAFYLSDVLASNYFGFGIVAGFYLLFGLILYIGRKKLLERPLCDKIINKILGNN